MGTDINGVFQRLDNATNIWHDVESDYEQERNYLLFAVLAGVRNSYGLAPISCPRGFPADFAVIDSDCHPLTIPLKHVTFLPCGQGESNGFYMYMGDFSYSWLTGSEMLEWYKIAPQEVKGNVAVFFEEVERLVLMHGKIRFVFGFDS